MRRGGQKLWASAGVWVSEGEAEVGRGTDAVVNETMGVRRPGAGREEKARRKKEEERQTVRARGERAGLLTGLSTAVGRSQAAADLATGHMQRQ